MTKKTDYFRTFCKVSSAFGSSLKKDELLDMIVKNAVGTMDGKAACLFLTEKDEDLAYRGDLVVVAHFFFERHVAAVVPNAHQVRWSLLVAEDPAV